jgi:hypothetical protein
MNAIKSCISLLFILWNLKSKYDIFELCLHNRLLADEGDRMLDDVSGFRRVTSG